MRGNVGDLHIRIETAALGRRILLSVRRFTNVRAYVVREFVHCDVTVAGFIGRALHSLYDVIREYAMAASPARAFERAFAIPARGQREDGLIQIRQLMVDLLHRGIGGNGSAMTRIG